MCVLRLVILTPPLLFVCVAIFLGTDERPNAAAKKKAYEQAQAAAAATTETAVPAEAVTEETAAMEVEEESKPGTSSLVANAAALVSGERTRSVSLGGDCV